MKNKAIIFFFFAIGLIAFYKKKKNYKIIVTAPEKISDDEFYK